MVGVGVPTLRELRSALLASAEPATAVNALREAGYAGGDAVLASFEQWLSESRSDDESDEGSDRKSAADLTLDEFGERAARFFHDAGWGNVNFSEDEAEGVAIIDIEGCWEAAQPGESRANGAGCHITTGLLAAFFGRIAGYPVAVLETDCSTTGGSRCRFLLGNAEVMNYKWEEMR